jgi:two-component system, OmpR family, sensor histidine kinase CpxA
MLRSAIENVVRNGIRYTPEGKSVDLTLEKVNSGGAATARLKVRDYGPGVPETSLARIFIPFNRVAEETESDSQGAG